MGFNTGQVRTHVAVAVLRALGVVSGDGAVAAVAFPTTLATGAKCGRIEPALHQLGIVVFWVDASGVVTIAGPLP
jgi:hypothetical protein